MPAASALKNEISPDKLSTSPKSGDSKGALFPFDNSRLVQELLSLGHEKITPEAAQRIAHEVESELQHRPPSKVSASFISKIVEYKLQELGILKAKARKGKTSPKPAAAPPVAAEEEITVSLSEKKKEEPSPSRTAGLLKRGSQTQLPTLEKFLTPIQASSAQDSSPSPAPPHANLKVSPFGLARICRENVELDGFDAAGSYLQQLYENVSRVAASAEARFAKGSEVETLSVEFYNSMANQEFYPHLPSLLEASQPGAYGGHSLGIDLPLGPDSLQTSLRDAKAIWEQGGSVSFQLENSRGEEEFSKDSFERFIGAIEDTILELPESVDIPRSVGLQLSVGNPLTAEFIRIALSGKYYPRFSFTLKLSPEYASKMDDPSQDGLLQELWRRSDPEFTLLDFVSGVQAESLPPVSPRPGGGPALEPYEICQLGSINLAILAAGNDVDWVKLRRIVRTGVHFLDNLMEVSEFPSELSRNRSLANRKIGVGIMGFAELLIKLGYPYDSEDAQILAEKIMRFIHHEAVQASQSLARVRGVFPNYSDSPWRKKGVLLRNASLTAVVPAPSLAELAGVSPGLSPLESILKVAFQNSNSTEEFSIHPLLKEISIRRQMWNSGLESEVIEKGSVRNSSVAPKSLRRLFPLREEISLTWQQRIQASFQKYSDGAIGLDLRIPEAENLDPLKEVLRTAIQLGIPQVQLNQNRLLAEPQPTEASEPNPEAPELQTEASPSEEMIDTEENPPKEVPKGSLAAEIVGAPTPGQETKSIQWIAPRPRPEVLKAITRLIPTGYGSMRVTVGYDEWGPYEVHAQLGKSGSHEGAQVEALSRLTTLLLSSGIDPNLIYEQLREIRCPQTVHYENREVLSVPDALAQVLAQELNFSEFKKDDTEPVENFGILKGSEEEPTVVLDEETTVH